MCCEQAFAVFLAECSVTSQRHVIVKYFKRHVSKPQFSSNATQSLLCVRLQHNFGNQKLSVYTKYCFISLYTQCEMKLKNAHIFLGITCKKINSRASIIEALKISCTKCTQISYNWNTIQSVASNKIIFMKSLNMVMYVDQIPWWSYWLVGLREIIRARGFIWESSQLGNSGSCKTSCCWEWRNDFRCCLLHSAEDGGDEVNTSYFLVVAISFFADCNGGLNQNKFVD